MLSIRLISQCGSGVRNAIVVQFVQTSSRRPHPPQPPSPTPLRFVERGEPGKTFWLPLSTSGGAAKLERGLGGEVARAMRIPR